MKSFSIGICSLGLVAISLIGCDISSSDDKKSEVSTYEKLPSCSTDGSTSGVPLVGEKVYVSEEDMTYLCSDSGWVVSSVNTFDALPLCPGSRGRNLGLKVYVETDSVYYSCGTAGWLESEENSNGDKAPELENGLVSGSATAIGPFLAGSEILLQEADLDTRTKKLSIQEKAAKGSVTSANGDFVVANVNSYSEYGIVTVKGLFKDALTGETSEDTLELKGFVRVNSGDVQVNVESHILYGRVAALVNKGYKVEYAIAQAKKELYNAFGFGSSPDESAAALAVAILLRSNLDGSDFVDAVNTLADDFAEDGSWDNDENRAALADFAFNIENLKLKDEETGEILLKESDYRKHLEAFGLESVAGFEEYLTKFWVASYGLGGCKSARQNAVVQNRNESSDSAQAYFTCDASSWRVATDIERDTVGLGNAPDGELVAGNVNADKMYVFDTTGFGSGTTTRWKEPDSIVLVIGKSCTAEEDMAFTVVSTEDADGNDNYYSCVNRNWGVASEAAFRIGYECNASAKNVVEKYKNAEKTDTYARCHESKIDLGDGTEMLSYSWMPTNELNYDLREAECAVNEVFASGKKYYVCTDAENIDFREASEDEVELGVCNEALMDSISTYKKDGSPVYRVCGENAYIPGRWEWSATDETTFKIGKVCSAAAIGQSGNIDSDSYTCGCSVYDATLMDYKLVTDADECGYNPLAWQKN